MSVNTGIFKAYDIRGIYPGELNEATARQIGRAFVAYLGATRIAVGRDMRVSAPSIAAAFIAGAREQGADVVDYGMIATDMLYFAVARDGHQGGAMVTASHNPKDYIGMKLVRAEAFPLSGEAGISQIRDLVAGGTIPPPAVAPGSLTVHTALLDDYVSHVLTFIDPSLIKPFNVVLDAGSGMGGLVAPKLFEKLPCRTTRLCFEIDGTFPNHEANPLIEENRRDLVERVVAERADIGIAWDGDADRCIFVNERGDVVDGDQIMLLCARAMHRQNLLNHNTVVSTVMSNMGLEKALTAEGITMLRTAVGDKYVLREMLANDYDLGGEQSGHIIFRRFATTGDGLITAAQVLKIVSEEKKPFSELTHIDRCAQFLKNIRVPDKEAFFDNKAISDKVRDVEQQLGASGRVLVRPSGTEPKVRVMVETWDAELAERLTDEIIATVQAELGAG